MNTYRKALLAGGIALALGLQTIVFGQGPQPAPATRQAPAGQQAPAAQQLPTTEQRVRQLEQSLLNLQTELQRRTATLSGPEDGISRDFNLETRLTNIERQLQQLNNSVLEMQRQVADASRAASQAQSDAMQAQQIARDAQLRIN
jgi:uncharacterized protein HemX